jgi:hypothetical protein
LLAIFGRWLATEPVTELRSFKTERKASMNRNGLLVFAACCILATSLPSTAADKPAPASGEKAKIEALLKNLESLKEASFIRNDTTLPPKEAAALMRRKWEAAGDEIKTATEFIDKIMTVSTSGAKKPYLIRFKDGKETKCADYLKAELKKLETAPKEKDKP